jgi:hypothetical protein
MDKQAARYLPLESSLTTAQIYDKPIRKIRTPKSCVFAKSSLSFSQICGDDEKALQYETVGGLYTAWQETASEFCSMIQVSVPANHLNANNSQQTWVIKWQGSRGWIANCLGS